MGRGRRAGAVTGVLLAASLVAVGPVLPAGQAATNGPVNLGFEDGVLDGAPTGWTISPTPPADGVTVVDEETGADSPTYATTNTVVRPYNGARMLRLGTPKDVAETQSTGLTSVTQQFQVPDGDAVVVAARILSWEFRDIDRVGLRADGAYLAHPATFFGGTASARTCDASTMTRTKRTSSYPTTWSCDISMVGTKGILLDSDWQVLHLTPLPDADTEPDTIRLTYTVEGTDNSSHATWAYLDDVNRPPVAQFTSEPPLGSLVYEGSLVQLRDTSYDPDRPDALTSWVWNVTGPDHFSASSTATDPSFFPPQQGPYNVTLSVTSTDPAGVEQTSQVASTITVLNAPPLTNALDVEVTADQAEATVPVRYLDQGWLDTHTVSVDGGPAADLPPETDPQPALTRGRFTVPVTSDGGWPDAVEVPVEVTVDDGEAGSPATASTDVSTISVVPAGRQLEVGTEADDTVDGAPTVVADVSRLSWLQRSGDIDIVELELAGGPLLPGTEVLAALDEVPADLDLVVLARTPGSVAASPYQMAPYQMAPYQMAPYQMAPYQMASISVAPYQMAPYQMAPYQMAAVGLSPYQMAPYQMAPYQMAALSTDSDVTTTVTGGGDIDPAELGISELLDGGTLQIAGFSANRGLEQEAVLVRVDQPGTRLFVVVVGANDTYDADTPYRLRLESSATWNAVADADASIASALQSEYCSGTPVADRGVRPPAVTLQGAPSTLIVTQLDRLQAAHPDDDWDRFVGALAAYAEHPLVQGRVLDLPTSIYDDWDRSPCRVAEANRVTDAIRTAIQAELSSGTYEYVVILGDDSVIPFRRTTTGVVVGDESQYLAGSFLKPGSPLAAALAASQELTDDYYTDAEPTPFQTGELYLPDVATARMVETPAEIAGQMQAFVDTKGYLDARTAVVAAHDFLADGGNAIADTLAGVVGPDALTRLVDTDPTPAAEQWSADDLRCAWLGSGDGCADGADVVSPNSHWTHYASLSARGFATDLEDGDPGLADILTSAEVGTTPSATPQLVFTIGCHAGFSVPDDQSLDGTAYGIDPALDFPQALARRQAVYVASTGFGLGDTEGLAGTEQLMADFAEALLQADRTAGQALLAAKRGYASGLSTVSTYDAKALMQQTMYGPPQYRVFGAPPSGEPATLQATAETTGSTAYPFALDARTSVSGGTYWTVDGDVQITPGRPWQPRAVYDVDDAVHGAVITGGTYRTPDLEGVTPVITRPTVEWEQGTSELADTCRNSWWPADLTSVTDGALVVIPGQFRCTPGSSTGTQRLFDTLDIELTTSTSTDRLPPQVGPLDIRSVGEPLPDERLLELSFPATDEPISRIVPLILHDGTISSAQFVDPTPRDGMYRVQVAAPSGTEIVAEIVVQVVDGAGNVTTLTGRGANLRYLPVTATSPVLATPGADTTFEATLTDVEVAVAPVQYLWDFGDGTTASGVVTGDTIAVPHTYTDPLLWTERHATLRVWDADGATGTVDVRVIRQCDDLDDAYENGWADLVGCGVRVAGGKATFTIRLAEPVSPLGSYRVEITTGTGKKQVTTKLKYDPANASYSGAKSLVAAATDSGYAVVYTLDVADLGTRNLTELTWFAEVQSGISGVPTAGFVDRMPSAGALRWPTPS